MTLGPDHPIWDVAQWLVSLALIAVVLWHNASNFDQTETVSIGQIGTLLMLVFGARIAAKIRK